MSPLLQSTLGVSAGNPAAGGGLSGNAGSGEAPAPAAPSTTAPVSDTLLVSMNNRGSHQNNADSSDGSGDDADAVAGVGGPFADASQSPLSGGDPPSLTDADGGVTQFSYNASGNLASLTDPDQNTTAWSYNSQNNVTQQTDSQGNSAAFAYNSSGQLVSYTDMDGNVRTYQYDSAGHVIAETLYATAADAAAGQNAEDTLDYAYDSSGNLTSESDDDSSDTYTYDSENRLASATETSLDAPTVVLAYQYSGTGTQPSGVAATIGGVADYQDAYTYNSAGAVDRNRPHRRVLGRRRRGGRNG